MCTFVNYDVEIQNSVTWTAVITEAYLIKKWNLMKDVHLTHGVLSMLIHVLVVSLLLCVLGQFDIYGTEGRLYFRENVTGWGTNTRCRYIPIICVSKW